MFNKNIGLNGKFNTFPYFMTFFLKRFLDEGLKVTLNTDDMAIENIELSDEFEYAQKTVNLGAKAYLLKPVDEDELQKKVEEIKTQINESKANLTNSKSVKEITEKEQLIRILHAKNPEYETKPATEFFKNMEQSTYQVIMLSSSYCTVFQKDNIIRDLSGKLHFMGYYDHSCFLFCQSTNYL